MTNERAALYERLLTYDAAIDEIERLRAQLLELCGTDNHLSTCDRSMGDSHPCTCGTRRIYRELKGLDATPGATNCGEDSASITSESSRPRELPIRKLRAALARYSYPPEHRVSAAEAECERLRAALSDATESLRDLGDHANADELSERGGLSVVSQQLEPTGGTLVGCPKCGRAHYLSSQCPQSRT